MAERHTVDVDVEGSKPSSLPFKSPLRGFFLTLIKKLSSKGHI